MFLGLAESRKKGIGIGFQEMESFPKANAQTGQPPGAVGKRNAQVGTPASEGLQLQKWV